MKKKEERQIYSRGGSSGSVEPIAAHKSLKTGYSIENPSPLPKPKEKVDKKEQEKFKAALGGAFKKIKQKKLEEAAERNKKESQLKKMPKMIIPDLGPDFRHEVKFKSSEEGQMEMLKKMAQKHRGK